MDGPPVRQLPVQIRRGGIHQGLLQRVMDMVGAVASYTALLPGTFQELDALCAMTFTDEWDVWTRVMAAREEFECTVESHWCPHHVDWARRGLEMAVRYADRLLISRWADVDENWVPRPVNQALLTDQAVCRMETELFLNHWLIE